MSIESRPAPSLRPLAAALAALAVLVLAPACVWVGCEVRGSGVATTRTRVLPAFERIAIRGGADVDVRVGEPAEVVLTLDDNLIDSFRTEVVGGVLELGFEPGSWSPRRGPSLRIVAPALEGIAIHGSGDVVARGVDADELAIDVYGSGDVSAEGRAQRVRVRLYGSGEVDLDALAAQSADVAIHGSGDVRVAASEALQSAIHGSGDVVVRGEPRVESSIAGSGTVRRR
jgi:hypothetical protein